MMKCLLSPHPYQPSLLEFLMTVILIVLYSKVTFILISPINRIGKHSFYNGKEMKEAKCPSTNEHIMKTCT